MQAEAFERFVGRQVTLTPGHRLHVLARALRLSRYVYLAREQRNVQQLGQLSDEASVLVGILAPKPVVDVQHGKLPQRPAFPQLAGDIRERRRIRPARHHQHRRRIGIGQAACREHRCRPIDQRFRLHSSHHALPSKNLRSNSSSGRGRPNRKPWI